MALFTPWVHLSDYSQKMDSKDAEDKKKKKQLTGFKMDQEKDDKIMNQNSDRKTKKKGWIQNVNIK